MGRMDTDLELEAEGFDPQPFGLNKKETSYSFWCYGRCLETLMLKYGSFLPSDCLLVNHSFVTLTGSPVLTVYSISAAVAC